MNLCIVIPTRNRPGLAIAAAKSALAELGPELCVIVSDNSASPDDVGALEADCRELGDPRLRYVRPPRELGLATHWDWALEQALELTEATHFTVQYDRKTWKPSGLARLWQDAVASPGSLLTYPSDIAFPREGRFVCGRPPLSGKLFEIASERVMALTARGMIREMGQAFPILSNCIVPRGAFERIRAAFGDLCDSSTPDAAFGFRFCAVEAKFRYRDSAAAIVHTFSLSNGHNYMTGSGSTWTDFIRLWGTDKPLLGAAPIPELDLGQNVTFHEYNRVRASEAGRGFPEIERQGYLRELGHAVQVIEDPARRTAMRERLMAYGWRDDPAPPRARTAWAVRARRLAGRVLRALGLRSQLATAAPTTFASDAEAIAFIIAHPAPEVLQNPRIAIMEPLEVAPAGPADPSRSAQG